MKISPVAALLLAGALPAAAQVNLETFRQAPLVEFLPNEFIVDYAPAAPGGLERFSLPPGSVASDTGLGFAVVRTGGAESFGAPTLEALEADPAVRAVYPNAIEYLQTLPDDPLADRLWMIEAINAAPAWATHSDASEIVVAVIDSGVHLDHEDIRDNLWTNAGEVPGNGVDDDGNGFVDDVHGYDFGDDDGDPNPLLRCAGVRDGRMNGGGHGTHVSGTVGAVGGNRTGVIGVAPKVRIMALKVQADRIESCQAVNIAARLRAMAYAIEMGANVVNLSLGGPTRIPVDGRLMQIAAERNMVVVVSAGNEGIDNDAGAPYLLARFPLEDGLPNFGADPQAVAVGPSFPAAWNTPTMIGVAATRPGNAFVDRWFPEQTWHVRVNGFVYDDDGMPKAGPNMEPFQLSGPAANWGSNFGARSVHVGAPGQDIVSAAPAVQGDALSPAYAMANGTSMAAPAVAGAAALLWSAFPSQTAAWVKERLMTTARSVPSLDGRVVSGGQIDLYAALCAPGAPRALRGCGGAGAPSSAPGGQAPVPDGTATTPAEQSRPSGAQNLNEVIEW